MRRGKVIFIKNALVLTVTGLIIRFAGMLFRVWLAANLGAEGMGLYSQIFSFYVLASVFASTGINTCVTRLVSEELARGSPFAVRRVLKRCVFVTVGIAVVSACVIFLSAEPIAVHLVGDVRAADSLKSLVFSLPFMGVSSCVKGYFIARKKTAPSSVSQILEQAVRIVIIVSLVGKTAAQGLAAACRAVIVGDVIAEICSFIYVYICFLMDANKNLPKNVGNAPSYSVLARLRHIALPITSGRYLNTMLRTAENLLVPRKIAEHGVEYSSALGSFGVIKGMALPLLFFPATFLSALSTLLVPEMSEAAISGRNLKVRLTAEKSIHITLISALPISVIFFYSAGFLGDLAYSDPESGRMMHLLAPIVPLMYLDSVCDGLLKGLDRQLSVFRTSMLDSLGRLALIMVVLPRFGLAGFIGVMYVSNLFTCTLNVSSLLKVSGARIEWFRWLILPGVTALTVGTVTYLALGKLNLPPLPFNVAFALITAAGYLLIVLKTGCLTRDDLR